MLFEKLGAVKAFAFDVDGVLTNGEVLVTEAGDQLRKFHIRDGYALQLAVKKGYPIVVITGAQSLGVQRRLEGLGIRDIYLGIRDKMTIFNAWLSRNQIQAAEVLYVGDDIPDLAVMRCVGIPACPADAAEEIKAIASYISPKLGGCGAVRDVIEKVMKVQQTWQDDVIVQSV